MRAMQFHPRKARISHQPRSVNKAPNRLLDIGPRHLSRLRPRHSRNDMLQQAIPDLDRDSAGRDSLREHTAATCNTERLAAWVADLRDSGGAVFLAGVGVFLPFCGESFVACVFVVEGWVERAAEVIDVDLDVAFFSFQNEIKISLFARGFGGMVDCVPVRMLPHPPSDHLV